jgi:hypothetical protein
MKKLRGTYILVSTTLLLFAFGFSVGAQTINVDASKLIPRAEVFLSPRTGSFVEGSTFDVPILLNTKGSNINGVEVRINFDKNKLSIIKPSSGKSIIGIWVEPPKYDNTKGTASYVGVIPDGITTDSGLIGTITFKALRTGSAVVSVSQNSNILLNDGLGTKAITELGRAQYSLITKAPEGVNIFSETHPSQSDWYNNNSPVISWDKDSGVDGFSFTLDSNPSTIPENIINSTSTSQFFENLGDGLWYFHIKADKKGVWGTTGHFLVRIDTTPPAAFKPEVNYVLAAAILVDRAILSFFTTDNLSGIDHYEVGVIDKNQSITESPVFVQTESPYQVPLTNGGNLRVIVRAIDNAGNVKDSSIDVKSQLIVSKLIAEYPVYVILIGILIIILISLAGLYIHHIFARRRAKINNPPQPPALT